MTSKKKRVVHPPRLKAVLLNLAEKVRVVESENRLSLHELYFSAVVLNIDLPFNWDKLLNN